jgi:phospholipase C
MKRATRSLLLLASLSATFACAQTTFQHIIVIVQENRTPDNLFQGLCAAPYGTCPSPYNISPNGVVPNTGASIR